MILTLKTKNVEVCLEKKNFNFAHSNKKKRRKNGQ
jgi:hypothetical protein